MSSPIAKAQKSGVDRALIHTHHRFSHKRRIAALAREFAQRIREVGSAAPGEAIRVLDVGCGDMTLADAISGELGAVSMRCVDIHPCPAELANSDPRWKRYSTFDGRNLEFPDRAFDAVIFSDVLHHVPEALRRDLLASAGRVGRVVIVKDHLEYGWFSRAALRAMDWFGNAAYGVSVPERYYDKAGWEQQCRVAGLTIERLDVGMPLYAHLPVLKHVLRPSWHFVAVCRLP